MENKKFLEEYFLQFKKLIDFKKEDLENLINVSTLMKDAHKNNKKTLIFGNGGSLRLQVTSVLILQKRKSEVHEL